MERKITGEERRERLLGLLKNSTLPITGADLATRNGVSRQVIVQDLSLLKASGHDIVATPRGYLHAAKEEGSYRRKVVCRHTPEELGAECDAIVDEGVTILDVIVEHPVYGFLTGELMLKSRRDVRTLITRLRETDSPPLSSLTDGIHIHTLEADSEQALDAAVARLETLGILISELDA